MERKYGKKKEIKINPLDYNLGLIGLSGIGKSTVAKEICEQLVGENGYLALDISKENGHDAIPNIMSETIPDWDYFVDVCDDIIENRNTTYKDLKVIVYDTIDDLFELAEKEVISLSNRKHPEKRCDSVSGAFGGYGRGQDKTIELVIDKLWELKSIGISIFVIGHTKTRTLTDPVTGEDYDMITTNISNKYFNAIKNKLHILGVANIERDIKKINKGKNSFTGKVESKGVIEDERRIINFRDDNYSIDSKSRFSEIIPKIKLDAGEFITAIKDAIVKAYEKQSSNKTIEEVEEEQSKIKEVEIEKNIKAKKDEAASNKLTQLKEDLKQYCITNKSDKEKLQPIMSKSNELGFVNPMEIDNLEKMEKLMKLIK